MDFRDYLMSLEWNSFKRYPEQGLHIYIHCTADDDSSVHRFFEFNGFNAVSFDKGPLVKKLGGRHRWLYSWLPAEPINDSYAEFTD